MNRSLAISLLLLGVLPKGAAAVTPEHQPKLDRINKLKRDLYYSREIDLLGGAAFNAFYDCHFYNASYDYCSIPNRTIKTTLPLQYWTSLSKITVTAQNTGFDRGEDFTIVGLANTCVIKPQSGETDCVLPDTPSLIPEAGDPTLSLSLTYPQFPTLQGDSSKIIVENTKKLTINKIILKTDSVKVIDEATRISEEVANEVRSSLTDYYQYRRIRDATDFSTTTLDALYTTLVNVPSEGTETPLGNPIFAASGSLPLVGYPHNKIESEDGTIFSKDGKPVEGLCGMPYTSHQSEHCQSVQLIANLLCKQTQPKTIDPDTLEEIDPCLSIEGQPKNEIEEAMARHKTKFESGAELLEALQSLSNQLVKFVLIPRAQAVQKRISSYETAYQIYLGIQKYERDTKTTLTTQQGLAQLKIMPTLGAGGRWEPPYVTGAYSSMKDAWGHDFKFYRKVENGYLSVYLESAGADNILGNADDLAFVNGSVIK